MRFERQVLKDAIRNALETDLNEVAGEPENVGAESLGQNRFEQRLELRLERRLNRRIERLEQRMEKRLERRLQRRMARRSWVRNMISSFFGGANVAQTDMETYAEENDREDFDNLATEILDIVKARRGGQEQSTLNEEALLDRLERRMNRRLERRGERRVERQADRRDERSTERREKRREEIAEALNAEH